MPATRLAPIVLAAALAATACGGDPATGTASAEPTTPHQRTPASATPVVDPGDGGDYSVDIDPADFTSVVDHPYLPKLPGARWVYRSTAADGEVEIITVEVLDQRRVVMGVETIVVHDVVETEGGELVEDTYDWFAQDSGGNVWYFGEDTTAYRDDGTPSAAGAWEAGVGVALPGIVMPATPQVTGTGYRQEFLAGEAEDMAEVIAVSGKATVPAGRFDDVITTRDWTPLEPETVEVKTYARGVGFVHETKPAGPDTGAVVELVEFMPGR
ncbi:MAG: hypothetical protein OEY23_10430 [Acidimicrobiia bacterium]|nr:hypothetical protein [Acidimicrobiia bacterium]